MKEAFKWYLFGVICSLLATLWFSSIAHANESFLCTNKNGIYEKTDYGMKEIKANDVEVIQPIIPTKPKKHVEDRKFGWNKTHINQNSLQLNTSTIAHNINSSIHADRYSTADTSILANTEPVQAEVTTTWEDGSKYEPNGPTMEAINDQIETTTSIETSA